MDKQDVVYTYAMKYYSAIEKSGKMPAVSTWMDLETVILSEVRQKRKYNVIASYGKTEKKNILIKWFTK